MIGARTTGALALTSAAMIFGLMSERGGAHPTGSVTWSTVSRVLEQRCLSCHGPQGSAQPRLDSFESARLVANAMKAAVLERRMPPSYAVEGFGEFANDPSLTPMEVAWIADWVDAGTPADVPGAESADPGPVGRVLLDQPTLDMDAGEHAHAHMHHSRDEELVLRPTPYQIDQPSHTSELPTGLTRERWVRGWEVQPGNAALVLSATVSIAGGTTIGTWMAGDGLTMLPEDVGARLPQDSTILLTVKYRRATRQTPDQTSLRLLLGDAQPRELRTCRCRAAPLAFHATSRRWPCGHRPNTAGESLTVEARVRIADRADGLVPHFPRAHDRTYRFRRSIPLPEGTAMTVAATDAQCGVDLEYVTP